MSGALNIAVVDSNSAPQLLWDINQFSDPEVKVDMAPMSAFFCFYDVFRGGVRFTSTRPRSLFLCRTGFGNVLIAQTVPT